MSCLFSAYIQFEFNSFVTTCAHKIFFNIFNGQLAFASKSNKIATECRRIAAAAAATAAAVDAEIENTKMSCVNMYAKRSSACAFITNFSIENSSAARVIYVAVSLS